MALKEIPTGPIPEEIVEALPKTGEENKVYRRLFEDPSLKEEGFTEDFIWYDNEWHPFRFDVNIPGAYFEQYQDSVQATVAAMEQTIEEQGAMIEAQAAKITELEQEVFPKAWVSFEMSITSLVMTHLDLVDEEGNLIEEGSFTTDIWESEPMTYQAELKAGTYYLRNSDGYALGKPNGDIQPLISDGTEKTVQIGSVEIVMIQTEMGEGEVLK